MKEITTIEGIFETLASIGFVREPCSYGVNYRLDNNKGSGYIQVIGKLSDFYLTIGDLVFYEPVSLNIAMSLNSRFIELSYAEVPMAYYIPSKGEGTILMNNLACHINSNTHDYNKSNYEIIFPEKQRLKYINVIIRDEYILSNFPHFHSDYLGKDSLYLESDEMNNPRIVAIMDDLMNRDYLSYANQVYLNSKVIEIISLLVTQLDALTADEGLNVYVINALKTAKKIVEENHINPPSLKDLSLQVGINVKQLKDGFKQLFGVTVFQHVRRIRMRQSRVLLVSSNLTIEEISNAVGYASTTHFYKNFRKEYGVTPLQFRKHAKKSI